jgi:tRNA pseudouridine55 synthase
MTARSPRRAVDGVLLLDKPLGMSSNRALQLARRRYGAAKAGHTGTLDPLATGLLVVLFGEATKFAAALLGGDKTYEATVRLGVTTSTGDAEGEVLSRREPDVSRAQLDRAVGAFVGELDQVPPRYSALKKDGRPYYAYARAGQEVERRPRKVIVYGLSVQAFDGHDFRLEAHVGTGTYLRTLAEDIGTRLGCGAHLAALRRTAVGPFRVGDAVGLPELERLEAPELQRVLRPVDALLGNLPQVVLDAASSNRFVQGQPIALAARDAEGDVRVYGPEGRFIGRGHAADGWLRPGRVLATAADD